MIHHPVAIHASVTVPESAEVWQFSTILGGTKIGEGVVIGANCWIGRNCKIGKGTRLQTGVFLPNGTVLEEDCFIGPHAAFTDDKYPRAGRRYDPKPPVVRKGASIGANATVLPGVEIGENAFVAAHAVVVRDVAPNLTVIGVPAKGNVA